MPVAGECVPVTSSEKRAVEAAGFTKEEDGLWGQGGAVRVDGLGRDMAGDGVRQGLVQEGSSAGDVIRRTDGKVMAFDLGMNGVPVGIPVGAGVIVNKFRRDVRARSKVGMTTMRDGKENRSMVTANEVKDFCGDAPKEVGRGEDHVGNGIGFGSGVLWEGNQVSLEGG